MSDQGLDGATPDEGRADRRTFLKRAGVVGAGVAGAAWVAPSMLSLDQAYAVGSCPGGTIAFSWAVGAPIATGAVLHTATTTPLVGTSATGGIDVRITENNSSSAIGAYNNWKSRSSTANQFACGGNADYPMGNAPSFYSLEMSPAASCTTPGVTGRTVDVTFGFFDQGTTNAHAVKNLNFTLLDIDGITADYRDEVQVFLNGSAAVANTGAGTVFPTVTNLGSVAQLGTTATFQGATNSNVPGNGTGGNVTLNSDTTTAITSVRILFTDTRVGGPTTIQWIGIGDLTFCKV